jgi:glycosyltransferase involved in cell wall biosynthesis
MMKGEIYTGSLDIIITHYKEPWSLGMKLFHSIAMQRDIRFDDVGVILVNDGEENELPAECFEGYPYEIHQMSIPHGGVSRARNAGLDAADADWVMFCDFDDMFSSVFSLHLIFAAIAEDKGNLIRAAFTEETKDNDGVIHLVSHNDDAVFVHGKIMRRAWLKEQGIRFHEKLTIHEDGFFNVLVYTLARETEQKIQTPIYLWAWNDRSVVRKDNSKDYILDTYSHLMRQRMALTEEFIRRERPEDALRTVVKTVMDSYYDFQKHAWRLPKNKSRMERAERWFCAYLKRYAGIYAKANITLIADIAAIARARVLMSRDMLMESETLKDWLEHIMDDVRPIPEEEIDV